MSSLKSLGAGLIALFVAPAALAAAFSAVVGPPRFELKSKPGSIVRETLEIVNDSNDYGNYSMRTADWELATDGTVVFREELAAGSCRSWVRLERRDVRLAPRGQRRFRFEVHVPADAGHVQCRFAVLVEGKDDVIPSTGVALPMQGRIAVIVYVTVGDAKPALELKTIDVGVVNGRRLPLARFENTGTAHGRPEGTLEARDASGKLMEFTVAPSPILPGRTQAVVLWPADAPDGKTPEFTYPLRLKGKIEWQGGSREVDLVVRP